MKEKLTILVMMIVGLTLLGAGYFLGKTESHPVVKNIFPPKFHTEDMVPIVHDGKELKLVFADSVDGRPTYTVIFPDSTVVDSMYPEEVANGLNTGKWNYNEMWTITERQ